MGKNGKILVTAIAAVAIGGYALWVAGTRHPTTTGTADGPALTTKNQAPAEASPSSNDGSISAASVSAAFAFSELKARAQGGDPVAQRQLAETYDRCFMPNIAPENYLPEYELRAKHLADPQQAASMLRTARARADMCSMVDGGAIVPTEAIKSWLESAAAKGDLAAQSIVYTISGKKPDAATYTQLMEKIVASRDPAAVFQLGELVGNPGDVNATGKFADISSDPISAYAWQIVGCRMGYDCGASSPQMDTMCLVMNRCAGETYEEFVRSSLVPASDVGVLDRKIGEVSRLLKAQ